MTNTAPVNLLLVEDNDMDVRIFKRAMRDAGVTKPLSIARDGIEALEAIRGENGVQPVLRPNVILLDLNMPRMNGIEFLEELRADPNIADLVVFVLTTSDAPEDKRQAYRRHIAGYVLKTMSGNNLRDAVEMIDRYSQVVDLPH